jgi:hypothetical protein
VVFETQSNAVGLQPLSEHLRNSIAAWQSSSTHEAVRPTTAAFAEWFTKPRRQPLVSNPATAYAFNAQWHKEYQRLQKLTQLPKGWDSGEGLPVSAAVAGYALNSLRPFERVAPAPSFSTSGEGDVWALWAAHDLDIELHVRSPGDVFAMIEDARCELKTFEDEDPTLDHVRDALITLGNRVNADQRRTLPAPDPNWQFEYSTQSSGRLTAA